MERSKTKDKYEIESDGKTVWVNGGEFGVCLGRFSALGIDIHSEDTVSCILCTHETTYPMDWEVFKEGMARFHKVTIDDKHMPEFLKQFIQHGTQTWQQKQNRKNTSLLCAGREENNER